MSFPSRVDRPVFSPHRCVVLGKADDPKGWLDLGNIPTNQPDPRGYISHGGALTAAKFFGYDIVSLMRDQDRLVEVVAERDDLAARLAEAEAFIAAIDVIESREFKARRKPGRPKEKANA